MKTSSIIKNILKFCVPTIVSAIIAITVLPITSRVYPEAEYGYISNFFSMGNTLMGVVLLGLDAAYVRFFYEPPEGANRSGLFLYSLKTGLTVTGILTVFFLLFASKRVTGLLFNDESCIGLVLLGIYVGELVIYRMFNQNMRYSENAIGFNIQQIGFILFNRLFYLVAAIFTTRYIWAILIMTVGMFVLDFCSIVYQRKQLKSGEISSEAKKAMFRYAIPMIPTSVLTFANNSVAKLVLGAFDYRNAVGVMAIATSAANVFSIVPNAFRVYWSAFMYKYYQEEKIKIKKIHDVVMLTAVIMVCGVILIQDFIYSYLGANYRGSQQYFMILMLMPITSLMVETTGYGIYLEKKTEKVFLVFLAALICNFSLSNLLVPRYAALGAALGVGASATIIYFVQTFMAQRYYKSVSNWARTGMACVMIWGMCIANIWLYQAKLIRLVTVAIIIAVSLLLYKETIVQIARFITEQLKTIKRRVKK